MSNGETGWLRIYFEENAYTTVPATQSTTAAAILAPILRKKGLLNAATVNGVRHALFVTESFGESRSVDSDELLFERQLFDSEKPLEIQERMRKCGTIDQFKLTFRQVEEGGSGGGGGGSSSNPDALEPLRSSSHDDVASQFAAAVSASVNMEDSTEEADLSSTPMHHSLASQSNASFAGRTLTSQPSLASLAVLSDPTIVRCGYLDKRGKRNTAWKERWFVIKPNGLHYYKSHAHTSPIATIPLTDAFVRSCHCSCQGRPTLPFVAAPSITNLTTSPPLPTPHAHSSLSKCSYEFEIHTIVRVFFLRARSYPEMLNWLRDLQGQIPICLENQQLDEIAGDIEQLEYMECEREEARLASLTNLASLLTDAIGLEQLVQFETERHREKHVLAYLEAQGFARSCKMPSKSKSQLLERARTIYQEFFAQGAPQETVEVPSSERKRIQEAIQQGEPRPDLFEGVQTVLFEHLSEHSFPPFVHSKHFQRAMLKLSMVGAQGGVGNYQPSSIANAIAAPTTTITQPTQSNNNNNANHHLRNASTFPSNVLPDEPADLPVVTPALASGGTAEMKSKGGPEEVGKDQVDVDESHSISALPVAGGGLLSSLYGVGSAAVGAVGALVPIVGASASPEILIPNSSPSPDSANTPLSNGKNMSPGSLASYLESIGEVDAKKRSASLVANGAPNTKKDSSSANGSSSSLSTIPSTSSTTAGGDSDSDESEAEEHESEEEGMFGATPKVASSLLDSGDMPTSPTNGDRSSFTIPAQYQGKTNRGDNSLFGSTSSATSTKATTSSTKTTIITKSSVNDPLSSVTSITIDEEDPLFVSSRSRSIESASKPVLSSTSTLGVIKELDVRATPSVSLNEVTDTRPRQQDAGASFSGSDASPFAPSPQELSSEPRVATMEPQNPVEARRRSSALTQSAAPPPAQKAKAAAVVAAANSSSKWKKSKSIFDEDDDDEPGNIVAAAPASPFLSAKATAAAAKPTTAATSTDPATSSTTAAKPASNTSSATIDLAILKEEAVDLGDLNLDEEPDMF